MAKHVDQAIQPAVLLLFFQPAQAAYSAAVFTLLPAHYDMFNTVWDTRAKKQSTLVCVYAHCVPPHLHLVTNVLQALEICLG